MWWSKEEAAELLILMTESGYWPNDDYAQSIIDSLEMNISLDFFKETLKRRQEDARARQMRKWF